MERAGEWEKALAFFEGIRAAGGLPGDGQASPALFNAAISAAGRAWIGLGLGLGLANPNPNQP